MLKMMCRVSLPFPWVWIGLFLVYCGFLSCKTTTVTTKPPKKKGVTTPVERKAIARMKPAERREKPTERRVKPVARRVKPAERRVEPPTTENPPVTEKKITFKHFKPAPFWSEVLQKHKTQHVAAFIQTTKGTPVQKKTGAMLNWMLRRLMGQAAKQQKWLLLPRGLFFSPSSVKNTDAWNKRAYLSLEDGYKLLKPDPEKAISLFFQAKRFFEFAQLHDFKLDLYRQLLFSLGVALKQENRKPKGLQIIHRAFMLAPKSKIPIPFPDEEKKFLLATRFQMASDQKTGTLVLKGPTPHTELYLDGRLVGFGEVKCENLPAGTYLFKAIQDGRRNWGRKVKVVADKTSTYTVQNRASSNVVFFKGICPKLIEAKGVDESHIQATLQKIIYRFRAQRILVGCFEAAADDTGKLHWFALGANSASKNGSVDISAKWEERVKSLSALPASVGLTLKNPSLPPIKAASEHYKRE